MIENALIRQVLSLPELIEQQYNDLEPKARKALTTPEIFGIQRIVLTGCGDSYAAALATKHAFEMLTNLPCEVVPAIELSRLYSRKQLGFAPCNPLVIAVSNSGMRNNIVAKPSSFSFFPVIPKARCFCFRNYRKERKPVRTERR